MKRGWKCLILAGILGFSSCAIPVGSPIPRIDKRIEVRRNCSDKVVFKYDLRVKNPNSKEVSWIKSMLENIPDKYQEILNKEGLNVVICNQVDDQPEIKQYKRIRVLKYGKKIPKYRIAVYLDKLSPMIFISENSIYPHPDAGAHEVGHAFARAMRDIDFSPEFRNIYNQKKRARPINEFFASSFAKYYKEDSTKGYNTDTYNYFSNLERKIIEGESYIGEKAIRANYEEVIRNLKKKRDN